MLSNAYFLAKIRFNTAENKPAKNLQNFANFPNFAYPNPYLPLPYGIGFQGCFGTGRRGWIPPAAALRFCADGMLAQAG